MHIGANLCCQIVWIDGTAVQYTVQRVVSNVSKVLAPSMSMHIGANFFFAVFTLHESKKLIYAVILGAKPLIK